MIMMMVEAMAMIKCSKLGKEEREKQKAQGKGINVRSYFVLVIKTQNVITFRFDSHTIKRVKLVSKCSYQSATRCSNSLHMHLGSSGVLTPLKMFVKIC